MKKLIFILIGLLVLSCQDIENCDTDDGLDFLIVRFFDRETKEPKSAGFRFTVDGSPYRWVFAADTTITPERTTTVDGEEVIIPADTTIESDSTFILLPINSLAETTTYFFDTDTSSHLMELSYDASYSIFDESCVRSLTFSNIDTVQHTFDSLSIPGRVTNRQIGTNVEIYL
ncbi:MAG: hypothetical protein HRT61_02470 [Ekhidna sp.]|nr:hypothetical protein [Ekhidna sp.]